MEQVTPPLRDLARVLLALEAARSETAGGGAHPAPPVFEKLRSCLSKLVGAAGYQALLVRALTLAKAEVPWVGTVRVGADGTLEGFDEAARQQPAEAATEGSVALLARLLGLLVAFIGETLTLRLLGNVWPQARWGEIHAGEEGT